MLAELMNNPRVLSDEEIETYADEQIKRLSEVPDMTYDKAYKYLKSCSQILDEAVYHLGHNAIIETSNSPIKFVL